MDPQEQWLREQFDRVWPYLHAAILKTGVPFNREYVEKRIFDDHDAQLWPGVDFAAVTEIEVHPDGSKVLFGWLMGGSRTEFESTVPAMAQFGKRNGCTKGRFIGRKGLGERPFQGFKTVAVIMEREL